MSELEDMALFAAVVKANGFSRAAERIGVPVATVSRRLIALEKRLGQRLLMRTTRSMRLTEAGQVYLRYCEHLVSQAEQARNALVDLREEPTGHLVLVSTIGANVNWSSVLLADFMQRYPKISVYATLLQSPYDLDALNFDIAFVHGLSPPTRHVVQAIGDTTMMLCGSPAYFARKGMPTRLEDLAQHSLLLCELFSTPDVVPPTLRRYFETGRLICNEVLMARQAACDGCGLTWLPDVVIGTQLSQGDLLPVLTDCATRLPVWLVLPRNGVTSRKREVFLQHFLSAAHASAPWHFFS